MRTLTGVRAAIVIFLLLALPGYGGAAGTTASSPSVRNHHVELFNTIEFQGSLKALPHWLDTAARARKQLATFENCSLSSPCPAEAVAWRDMKTQAQKLTGIEQLKWINLFFNRWPYRNDLTTYGHSDYWASPHEFLTFSGDCEDYAIAKYFAFKDLGYPVETLRVVVVKDTIRNSGHAVLTVAKGKNIYVLDSLSELVFPDTFYQHYVPQYSVNENFRWAHIPKSKQTTRSPQLTKDSDNGK